MRWNRSRAFICHMPKRKTPTSTLGRTLGSLLWISPRRTWR
ncbi:unnamed protein product [Haemonchus placei]|uniref:Uncharacterized protein n=1 Tax=Haemonchus placei TaxID=6290 RepID=A0A0N4W7B2_HAEPC|nr:unnamed protein product [Haemonchus placei]